MNSANCLLLTAALYATVANLGGVDCASLPVDSTGDGDSEILRRLAKRQVNTIYYPPKDSVRHMGLDPYEERLLIILLGGCIAVAFALVIVVICCRTYRLDRNIKLGGGGGGGMGGWGIAGHQQPMLMSGPGGRQPYPGQPSVLMPGVRPAYYPTGYQPSINMDPAYLDPAKAGHPRQIMVDNTTYG